MNIKLIVFVIAILVSNVLSLSVEAGKGFEFDNNEEKTYSALKHSNFKNIPLELIIQIAYFLSKEDFHNFSITCSPIRRAIMGYDKFFMPEEEKALETIEKTNIEATQSLISQWNRTNKSKAIPILRRLLDNFSEHEPTNSKKNLKSLMNNYKKYSIILNLLYEFGDPKVDRTFRTLYYNTEVGLENTMNHISPTSSIIKNPTLYKFYQKKLSLLEPEVRASISKDYAEGKHPYTKDHQKSEKYSKHLGLPLTSNVIFKIQR